MATINPTFTRYGPGDNTVVVTWTPVTNADSAAPVSGHWGDYADRTIQISGTFDSATVVLQGSNDDVTYAAITDPQGNAISKTSAAIEACIEGTLFVKPTFSGGGASQSLTVTLCMRRQRAPMG